MRAVHPVAMNKKMAKKYHIHMMKQACRQVPLTPAFWELQLVTLIVSSPCFGSCEELELDDDGLEDLI